MATAVDVAEAALNKMALADYEEQRLAAEAVVDALGHSGWLVRHPLDASLLDVMYRWAQAIPTRPEPPAELATGGQITVNVHGTVRDEAEIIKAISDAIDCAPPLRF